MRHSLCNTSLRRPLPRGIQPLPSHVPVLRFSFLTSRLLGVKQIFAVISLRVMSIHSTIIPILAAAATTLVTSKTLVGTSRNHFDSWTERKIFKNHFPHFNPLKGTIFNNVILYRKMLSKKWMSFTFQRSPYKGPISLRCELIIARLGVLKILDKGKNLLFWNYAKG